MIRGSVYVESPLNLYKDHNCSLPFLGFSNKLCPSMCSAIAGEVLKDPVYILIHFLCILSSFIAFLGKLCYIFDSRSLSLI